MKKIDLSIVPAEAGGTYQVPSTSLQSSILPTPGTLCRADSIRCERVGHRHGCLIQPACWHSHEDEFVWVLDGELTLVTDAGEETLRAGDCAAFRSGDRDGHHLVNKSGRPARVLEIGTTDPQDRCSYPDVDMIADARGYTHRDGTPYPLKK